MPHDTQAPTPTPRATEMLANALNTDMAPKLDKLVIAFADFKRVVTEAVYRRPTIDTKKLALLENLQADGHLHVLT